MTKKKQPVNIDFDNLETASPCQSEDEHHWVEANNLYRCDKCGMLRA